MSKELTMRDHAHLIVADLDVDGIAANVDVDRVESYLKDEFGNAEQLCRLKAENANLKKRLQAREVLNLLEIGSLEAKIHQAKEVIKELWPLREENAELREEARMVQQELNDFYNRHGDLITGEDL